MTMVGKGLAAGGAIVLAAAAMAGYAVLEADDRFMGPAGIVALLGVAVAGFAPVMRGLDAAAPHVAGAIGGTIDAWRYHHALAHERRARVRA